MSDEITVIACVSASAAITLIGQATDSKATLTIKPVLGAFIAGSLLLGVSLWSGAVAKSFAVVLLVTAIVKNGDEFFTAIAKVEPTTPLTGGASSAPNRT